MIKFILPCAVRVFEESGHGGLAQTTYRLAQGDEIFIEPVETKIYDHRYQIAVPFWYKKNRYYLLMEEIAALEN